MLRAVIFDFDGVIVDSEVMHLEAFNKALQPYEVQVCTPLPGRVKVFLQ